MSAAKKDRLLSDLRRRILTMDLDPGMSLDEATLGQAYGLSRTPVRDVLRLLAGEGYVRIERNRGAFVSPMTHKTLRNFFRTAPPVYASIAALAVENHTAAQLAELEDAQARFREATEGGKADQMAYQNTRFHLIMGEMADNAYLWPSLQRLLIDHARIAQTFYRPQDASMRARMSTACTHHDEFIDAIGRGDKEAARRLALEHWALSRDVMEMFVRPDPLELDIGQSAS